VRSASNAYSLHDGWNRHVPRGMTMSVLVRPIRKFPDSNATFFPIPITMIKIRFLPVLYVASSFALAV
jgi:hypothetical protein